MSGKRWMSSIGSIARSRIIIILIVGCTAVACLILWRGSAAYKERSLNSWLEDLDDNYPSGLRGPQPWQANWSQKQKEPAAAIRAMGTNVIPTLQRDLGARSSDGPLGRTRIRALFVKNVEPLNAYDLQRRAIFGLATFGRLAKPAVPDLSNCLTNPAVAFAAAAALASIGSDGEPSLYRGLHGSNEIVFKSCASAIGDYRLATPAIIQYLMFQATNEPIDRVLVSLRTLSLLGITNRDIVEFISDRLTSQHAEIRARAAWCMLTIGDFATNSLPDLQRLLNDPDPHVRKAADTTVRALKK